eukprot:TRINITY_DN5130_c0_g3_i2.p2 TRINITY_DN5130_c0_g3~~TRINITY_DN5130_c0_g3_i2.p2  ORF type:complete len:145 (-),score=36.12 TRINITY_DN5130_c0_g3_i2:57-491(-)
MKLSILLLLSLALFASCKRKRSIKKQQVDGLEAAPERQETQPGQASKLMSTRILTGFVQKQYNETNSPMESGSGMRVDNVVISFQKPFAMKPNIALTVNEFDADSLDGMKYKISSDNVTTTDFSIWIETWHNTCLLYTSDAADE